LRQPTGNGDATGAGGKKARKKAARKARTPVE
jgi:hypothetical protein